MNEKVDENLQSILSKIQKNVENETTKWQNDFEFQLNEIFGDFKEEVDKSREGLVYRIEEEAGKLRKINEEATQYVGKMEETSKNLSNSINRSTSQLDEKIKAFDVTNVMNIMTSVNTEVQDIHSEFSSKEGAVYDALQRIDALNNEIKGIKSELSLISEIIGRVDDNTKGINFNTEDLIKNAQNSSYELGILKTDMSNVKHNTDSIETENKNIKNEVEDLRKFICEIKDYYAKKNDLEEISAEVESINSGSARIEECTREIRGNIEKTNHEIEEGHTVIKEDFRLIDKGLIGIGIISIINCIAILIIVIRSFVV